MTSIKQRKVPLIRTNTPGESNVKLNDEPLKKIDAAVADAQAFDELEKSFEKVLRDLEHEKGLERFRTLYETVLQAARRSHDNERRLAAKCKQLTEELVGAGARVTAALRLSEEDQTTIATLRKEIEKTWRQISASHDKESKLRSELSNLRLELEEATKQLEENKEHDAALDVVLKQKQELIQERDNQLTEILGMRQATDQLREELKQKEMQQEEAESTLAAVRADAASKRSDQERDMKLREKLEKEVRELKSSLDARQVELRNRAAEAQSAENVLKDYEQQIKELHVASNKVNKEYNELVNQGNRLQRELDAQTASCAQLAANNQAFETSLKTSEASLASAKTENARLLRAIEAGAAKLRSNEEKRSALETTRNELRAKVQALEHERDLGKREIIILESKVASMQHEREVLAKLKAQAEGSTFEKMDLVKVHEGHIRVLEGELAAHKAATAAAVQQETALHRQLEALETQVKQLESRVEASRKELEEQKKQGAEARSQIEERETRVAAQNQIYEKVRNERNKASRDLLAAQAELAAAKRELGALGHEVDALRANVKGKDTALMREKFAHSRAETEQTALATEVSSLEKTVFSNKQEAATLQAELRKLNEIVALAEQERAKQRREYDALLLERDVLGTQLVRRNDEVALLYAKLRLQGASLQAGEMSYKDRLSELRLVKARVLALQRDLSVARRHGGAAADLRRELQFLTKRLTHEQAKNKALSSELETPLNVHRWRKLEGSDPATYELIQKVQLLQRRLINSSEQLVERDLQIQEKEALCTQLQKLLERAPGPDAAEKLAASKASLRSKVRQLQAMKGELDMRHAQCDDYKMFIKRMQAEIDALKGHFFTQKRLHMQGTGKMVSDGPTSARTEVEQDSSQASGNPQTEASAASTIAAN